MDLKKILSLLGKYGKEPLILIAIIAMATVLLCCRIDVTVVDGKKQIYIIINGNSSK